MVLSMMSVNLMYVIDRIMLAGYSIDAMNASVISGNFVAMFTFFFVGIADSSEVFVGQYNGSAQYQKTAAPVWQMIYMSLAAAVIFVPLACFSGRLNMLPDYYLKDGTEYQQTLMYLGMLPALRVALSTFFIGRGKTKIITVAVAAGAATDIVLDYILIYGVGDIIPRMGCKGAALATIVAELVQVAILASAFFSAKNRRIYKTLENRRFQKELFRGCLRIGVPVALGNFASLLAWYLLQAAVCHVSKDVATVYNIGINLYIFFIFVGEGINKACAAICANMIGRGDLVSIEKIRRAFAIIAAAFGCMIVFPLIFFPEWIFRLLDMLPDDITNLYGEMRLAFALMAVSVTLETMLLSTWGILMAGGDTKYAALIYHACLWGLVVAPSMALYLTHNLNSVPLIYFLLTLWAGAVQFLLYRRYKSMKWYNKLV
jgi:MATE family multidrug resistance protein